MTPRNHFLWQDKVQLVNVYNFIHHHTRIKINKRLCLSGFNLCRQRRSVLNRFLTCVANQHRWNLPFDNISCGQQQTTNHSRHNLKASAITPRNKRTQLQAEEEYQNYCSTQEMKSEGSINRHCVDIIINTICQEISFLCVVNL